MPLIENYLDRPLHKPIPDYLYKDSHYFTMIRDRIKKLQELLEREKLDGFFSMNPYTVRYFSNVIANRYPERTVYFLASKENNFVLTYPLELEQTKEETRECEVIEIKTGMSLEETIKTLLNDKFRIGLELEKTPYLLVEKLRSKGIEIRDVTLHINKIRAVKDEEEIENIKDSIKKTELVLAELKELIINEKMTEKEAALKSMMLSLEKGSEWFAFEPIIASGKNASFPHAIPANNEIQENTFTIVDIGFKSRAGGYCSDITRTFVKGKLGVEEKTRFEIVKEALEEAIDAIKEGVLAKEIDGMARKVLSKHGLDKYFVHGLGHGLGLEVHEYPTINRTSESELLENYVITIEPGIYIPTRYGIRLEQDVLVKKDKAEILTKFPLDYS